MQLYGYISDSFMSDFESIDNSTDDPDYMSEQSGIKNESLYLTLFTKFIFS